MPEPPIDAPADLTTPHICEGGNLDCGSGLLLLIRKAMNQVPEGEVLEIRRTSIGYVTQFLRVIPRVPAETIVAEPLLERGVPEDLALERSRGLLSRLGIPERLWHLSPMTFSGGEQQRVNIARGFAAQFPVLLLDEPTASLDSQNRERVLELISEARAAGTAVVAVFHDASERARACSREISLN